MRSIWRTGLLLGAVALWTALWAGHVPSAAQERPTSIATPVAAQVRQSELSLREVEARLLRVLDAAKAATVHVQIESGFGLANGSGVVVSDDGYVLTAAHVSGAPDRDAVITFGDGRRVQGRTLGRLNFAHCDAGVVKISEPGIWPAAAMGRSEGLEPGTWCFALGYPGGFDKDRGPVLRIGRLIHSLSNGRHQRMWTDCVLLGGDSGGPLFDLEGRVIGVHSAIAKPTERNFHAPIDAFHQNWVALTLGLPLLGVSTAEHIGGALVEKIAPGSAAEKVGLRAGDLIARLDDSEVSGPQKLLEAVRRRKPGEAVKLVVVREGQTLELEAPLGRTWNLSE